MRVQYTERLAAIVESAKEIASTQRSPELFTVHVLTALSAREDSTFSALLVANGVNPKDFHDLVSKRSRQVIPQVAQKPAGSLGPSVEHAALLQGAVSEMRETGNSAVGTEHILLAALKYRPGKGAWATFGLSYAPVRASLEAIKRSASA